MYGKRVRHTMADIDRQLQQQEADKDAEEKWKDYEATCVLGGTEQERKSQYRKYSNAVQKSVDISRKPV
jgi:hypothetical protein